MEPENRKALRGLENIADELETLAEQRLKDESFLDWRKVRECWRDFLCGRKANQQPLWHILMFQAWHGN